MCFRPGNNRYLFIVLPRDFSDGTLCQQHETKNAKEKSCAAAVVLLVCCIRRASLLLSGEADACSYAVVWPVVTARQDSRCLGGYR